MSNNKYWPDRCTLMGCEHPDQEGHHHHFVNGHLSIMICRCHNVDQPGTKT